MFVLDLLPFRIILVVSGLGGIFGTLRIVWMMFVVFLVLISNVLGLSAGVIVVMIVVVVLWLIPTVDWMVSLLLLFLSPFVFFVFFVLSDLLLFELPHLFFALSLLLYLLVDLLDELFLLTRRHARRWGRGSGWRAWPFVSHHTLVVGVRVPYGR